MKLESITDIGECLGLIRDDDDWCEHREVPVGDLDAIAFHAVAHGCALAAGSTLVSAATTGRAPCVDGRRESRGCS